MEKMRKDDKNLISFGASQVWLDNLCMDKLILNNFK